MKNKIIILLLISITVVATPVIKIMFPLTTYASTPSDAEDRVLLGALAAGGISFNGACNGKKA
jgi:hypothetical protein